MKAMDLPSMNAGSVVRAALLPALVTLVLGSSFLLRQGTRRRMVKIKISS